MKERDYLEPKFYISNRSDDDLWIVYYLIDINPDFIELSRVGDHNYKKVSHHELDTEFLFIRPDSELYRAIRAIFHPYEHQDAFYDVWEHQAAENKFFYRIYKNEYPNNTLIREELKLEY